LSIAAFYNATILRIDTPTGVSTGGDMTWTNGSTVAVRCQVTSPMNQQRQEIAAAQLDVSAMIYIPFAIAAAAGVALNGARLLVKLDGETTSLTYLVRRVGKAIKDGIGGALSHVYLFVKSA
jgi:hypothetical protein